MILEFLNLRWLRFRIRIMNHSKKTSNHYIISTMSNNSQNPNIKTTIRLINRQNMLLCLLLFIVLKGAAQGSVTQELPPLPPIEREVKSLGYAGMYGGKVGDLILAMGGANFPNGMPWEGGSKVWSDDIFILND